MHIVDGALSDSVVIGGAVLAVAGIAYGLKRMDLDRIPQIGMLSATFFIASLIHVPVGPSSLHLILNGLIGLALGWTAFPALFIALLLQAAFFGYGGLIVLGVNTVNIALPAVLMGLLLRQLIVNSPPKRAAILGGIAGAGSIALTAVMVGVSLALSGDAFIPAAKLALLSHIPVLVVEALVTAATVYLLVRVKPDFFSHAER
ncbi:cobalt transporter CbiM [Leucothrix pacifica]|uniref:Cobalt transporter CbiM n=1 Tax=Leucothrix pacifica TaxID=1247513 RepID=A0A317C8K3_9GAMM|nr:cobalt transporter CbiM [Leucothrix pacifica]PWQ92640.1 cobalt transporter CbiM [Leucothrix pacifica]